MKQKVLILQVGNYADDVEFPKISREINEKYAELHGYDYKWETFSVPKDADFSEVTVFKFKYILKYFDMYDIITFIDADAAINLPHVNIESLIDNEHYIYLAQDIALYDYYNVLLTAGKTIEYIINGGVLYDNLHELAVHLDIFNPLYRFITNPYALNTRVYDY